MSSRGALTGKYGGEEDVVREGDQATFSQGVKDAVLICKLLSLLGNLLLVRVAKKAEDEDDTLTPSHTNVWLQQLPQVSPRVCERKRVRQPNQSAAMLKDKTHTLRFHTHLHNSPGARDRRTKTVMQMLHPQAGECGCNEKLVRKRTKHQRLYSQPHMDRLQKEEKQHERDSSANTTGFL